MNVGSISNINYLIAAGRVSPPAAEQYATPSVLPTAADGRTTQGSSTLFFNLDGDSAELSLSAMRELEPQGVCHTCQNRKYVDRSDDVSVSFQTPTSINPSMAAAAVASHEQEHVRNEKAQAHREDRDIVSQTVTLQYDCCPECGRTYVSGGTTKTTSISKSDSNDTTYADNYHEGDQAGAY